MTHPETEKLRHWKEGVEHFNARRFWHAHESWEQGWLALPEIEKLHVQCLIQVCGVFDLVKRGRPSAALSLAQLAHEKLTRVGELGGVKSIYPRIEVAGIADVIDALTKVLRSEMARPQHSEEASPELLKAILEISKKAELLLSPG
jgi:hypothetical protein